MFPKRKNHNGRGCHLIEMDASAGEGKEDDSEEVLHELRCRKWKEATLEDGGEERVMPLSHTATERPMCLGPREKWMRSLEGEKR